VTYREEDELPDHTLTMRYRFVHVLYQNALYATLTPSRRASLSARIADALLAFHGEASSDIASELAFLFQAARDWPRASAYFLKAARNAAGSSRIRKRSRCAGTDGHDRRMPDSPSARARAEAADTLGPSLMTVKGFAATETLQTFLRAGRCAITRDEAQLFRVCSDSRSCGGPCRYERRAIRGAVPAAGRAPAIRRCCSGALGGGSASSTSETSDAEQLRTHRRAVRPSASCAHLFL
jgi:hypothetical protein